MGAASIVGIVEILVALTTKQYRVPKDEGTINTMPQRRTKDFTLRYFDLVIAWLKAGLFLFINWADERNRSKGLLP